MTYSEAANLAVNQTVVRSINTSIVALLPVLAIIIVGAGFLGASTLLDLAVVLFIGMAAGTYSSIFFATPFLAQLKESQPEMKALSTRVLARRKAGRGAAAADAANGADDAGAPAPAAVTPGALTRTDSTVRQQPKRQARSKRKG
jgi:preprotein translocase subunit SecF